MSTELLSIATVTKESNKMKLSVTFSSSWTAVKSLDLKLILFSRLLTRGLESFVSFSECYVNEKKSFIIGINL